MAETYTITPNFDAVYDEYMADISEKNRRYRQLSVQRPDPSQPAFDARHEPYRHEYDPVMGARVGRQREQEVSGPQGDVFAPETNTNDPGYTITPAPAQESGEYSVTPAKPTVRDSGALPTGATLPGDTKPFHPGKLLDLFMEPVDPELSKDLMGKPPVPTVQDNTPFHPGKIIGRVGDAARELWHDLGSTAIDAALSPATYLLGGGMRGRSQPLPRVEPPPSSSIPIQDLAARAQGEHLLAVPDPSVPPVMETAPTTVGQYGPVREVPTGSLARGPWEHTYTQETGHTFSTTPSGSMVQLEYTEPKPQPYHGQVEGIPLPGERVHNIPDKTEPALGPSKRLHGRDLGQPERQGPPAPVLKSAEEILAEKEALQRQRFEDRLKHGDMPPIPPDSPGNLLDSPNLRQPSQAGPRSKPLEEFPGTRTLDQAPLDWRRVFQHAYDHLASLGPYTRRLRDIFQYSWDYSEQGTRQNFLDVSKLLSTYFSERSLHNRWKAVWNGDERPVTTLLNASHKDWGLSDREGEAVVELLYSGLNPDKVHPEAAALLPVRDARIQRFAREYWEIAFGRASSDPYVQAKAMIADPITGERYPVGTPNPYFPHQAINEKTKQLLTRELRKKLYEHGGYADKMSFDDFSTAFTKFIEDESPEIRQRKYAGLEYKRFFDAQKEAIAQKTTTAKILQKYGYETDLLRALVRHNMFALKRAKSLEFGDEVAKIFSQLDVEYANTPETLKWIKKVRDRTEGISAREDMLEGTGKITRIAQAIAYPIFLRGSWKQNMLLQPNYLALQTGFRPLIQGIWEYWGGKLGLPKSRIAALVDQSGDTFPAFLTKYHLPEGPFEQFSKMMLHTDLFSPSDVMTRRFAGLAGGVHTENLAKRFWQNPSDPVLKGKLEELHINVKDLYKDLSQQTAEHWDKDGLPRIPDKYLLRGMQTAANQAMGRTGIHSMQLWSSGDTGVHHFMLMLKRQILSNEGTIIRAMLQAPSVAVGIKRAIGFFAGAGAAGYMYNGLTNVLLGKDFNDVNESMVKAFGGHKNAALAAKSILLGAGTLTAGIALSAIQMKGGNKAGFTYSLFNPAAASLADEILNAAMKGDLTKLAARSFPGEVVSTIIKRHEREEQERKRKGMGLGNPLKLP